MYYALINKCLSKQVAPGLHIGDRRCTQNGRESRDLLRPHIAQLPVRQPDIKKAAPAAFFHDLSHGLNCLFAYSYLQPFRCNSSEQP